jgi:hypothetical protein
VCDVLTLFGVTPDLHWQLRSSRDPYTSNILVLVADAITIDVRVVQRAGKGEHSLDETVKLRLHRKYQIVLQEAHRVAASRRPSEPARIAVPSWLLCVRRF